MRARVAGAIAALALGCGPAGTPTPVGAGDPKAEPEPTALCVDLDTATLAPVDPFGSDQLASDDEILAVPDIDALYSERDTAYSEPVKTPTGEWVIASVRRCDLADCPASVRTFEADGAPLRLADVPGGINARGDARDITLATYDMTDDGKRTVWLTYIVEGDKPQFHIAVFSLPELELQLQAAVGDVTAAPYEQSCVPVGLGAIDANCDDTPDLVLDRICGVDACLGPDAPLECMFRDTHNERTVFLWRNATRQYVSAHDLGEPTDAPLAANATISDRASGVCAAARRVNAAQPACELIDASRVDAPGCERWAQTYLGNPASGALVESSFDCITSAADCAAIGACMSTARVGPRDLTAEELARVELATGIPACDVPYNKYIRCVAGSAPDEVVNVMIGSLVQSTEAWKQAAATPEGRANLESLCPTVAAEWESAAKAMGCAW